LPFAPVEVASIAAPALAIVAISSRRYAVTMSMIGVISRVAG
jgi:hypothetical protein